MVDEIIFNCYPITTNDQLKTTLIINEKCVLYQFLAFLYVEVFKSVKLEM